MARLNIWAACWECHQILDAEFEDPDPFYLRVKPCSNCMEDRFSDGVIEGALNGEPIIEQEGEDLDAENT
jgi:hypothetical protein